MIAVSVRKDGITVSGHAEYAEAGKDIVCAGVTALVQGLIGSVESLISDKLNMRYRPEGLIYITGSVGSRNASGGFLFIGVCQIADEFPDHVRIE